MNFTEIIELSKNWPIQYSFVEGISQKTLRTNLSSQPWSITECETEFLQSKILQCKCKRGLEIGTGTGISCVAAGIAFKENNGVLITLDPFIEEYYGTCNGYTSDERVTSLEGVGKHLEAILEQMGLSDTVFQRIGFSPEDVPSIGEELGTLDYVLIDACHNQSSIKEDFKAVLPYLDEHCIIFFHDSGCISSETEYLILEKFGGALIRPPKFRSPHGFELAYLER